MRAALIVIDLQNDLCRDTRRADKFRAGLPRILELVGAFDRLGEPVFYTRFELEPDDPQFERFGDRYCIRGTDGCELIDEIHPLSGPVVAKSKHSAFFETELEELLRAEKVDSLVLCGLQTQICVLLTAADAHHRGFDVVVATDAVISTREQARLDAVEWIDRYVGRARTVDQVLAELG